MDLDKDSFGLDLKDVDSASVDTLTVGIDSIAQDCDFSELVDSIYNDKVHLFPSKLYEYRKLRKTCKIYKSQWIGQYYVPQYYIM